MRINKYIATSGFCSRRQADEYIQNKQVTLNGEIAQLGDQVQSGDIVLVDGKKIRKKARHVYLLFYKPVGLICTTDTSKKDNIIDYINYPERVFPVGRLDVQSSGLILLTNDGDFSQKILRPEYHIEKEYYVRVDQKITSSFISILKKGVDIGDGYRTRQAEVRKLGAKSFTITLTEGRNRQIRRMCDALGYNVVQLRRIRIAFLGIEGLNVGEFRHISSKEVYKLLH